MITIPTRMRVPVSERPPWPGTGSEPPVFAESAVPLLRVSLQLPLIDSKISFSSKHFGLEKRTCIPTLFQ